MSNPSTMAVARRLARPLHPLHTFSNATTATTWAAPAGQFGGGGASIFFLLRRTSPRRHASSSSSSPSSSSSSSSSFKRKPSGKENDSNATSSSSSSPPRVLEKPDRFRPPSHPARLGAAGRRSSSTGGSLGRNYGPELTAEERSAQRNRQYPHMMPPEGSWMHWFLTNRTIHLWITMTFLFGCGIWAFVLNVKQNSPFAHMLPSAGELLRHPFDSIYRTTQVIKMSGEHTSRVTAERRRRDLEEVQKRKAYRIAHGLEGMDGIDEADPIFAAALASRLEREEREKKAAAAAAAAGTPDDLAASQQGQDKGNGGKGQERKKWFGVW